MFSTLRSRLWLTNAILIGIVLGISGLVMVLFVRGIPLRTTEIRLREVSNLILQHEGLDLGQIFRQETALNNLAERFQVRILVVAGDGSILVDTASGDRPPLRRVNLPGLVEQEGQFPITGTTRDGDNRIWQFSLQPLVENRYLLLAAQRPVFQWLTVFTDDLLPPLLAASTTAVMLAVALSWLTARGISRPLQEIAQATRGVAEGDYRGLRVSGPAEVRQLAESFNSMIGRVRSSRQAQRDFVANVSHELKTPLTSIQGFAQAMLDGTIQDQAGLEKAAGVIYDEAGRMHRLVVELLDLARLDSGTAPYHLGHVDLSLLLESMAAKFEPQANQAGVDLQALIEPDIALSGDGDRLAQVFTNLIDNALQYTRSDGLVKVRLAKTTDWAVVYVSDSGPGIAPEDAGRIFERFYQVDKSRARTGRQGTGLGLPIAKEIVEAHGGSIAVDSRPGKGSVFVVKLPLVRPDGAASGKEPG